MFSRRTAWSIAPNRIAAALEERRRSGSPVLDLTETNPTRVGLPMPEAEIRAALADARMLRYEPTPFGDAAARRAVSAYHGGAVPPEHVVLTASTSEAYAHLFKLLADPGDEVLVPRPSYPLFEFLARLESVRAVEYPLVYDGTWRIDFEALEASLTPRARAIVVVNPNNPTGSFLKRDELARLIQLAARRGVAIVSDEVFSDYAFAPDPARATTLATVAEALTFCLSGLSKIAGLPQMKLGWIVTAGPEELRARAFTRLELIADTYLSVAAPVQHAAARLMEAGAQVRDRIAVRVRENLAWLRGAAAGSALSVLEVEGGWYATLRVPATRSEEEWTLDLLERDGVLVQPGFFYDFETEAFLVLSLLTPPDVFREGVGKVLARTG